jgi:hypothetical protein
MASNRESQGTDIEPGIVARVVAGVKYIVSGSKTSFFGPQQPLQPIAQDQAQGRLQDYPFGFNQRITPRGEEAVSFAQMRGLADGYDLLRLVIETRKDQMAKLEWDIRPKDKKKKTDDRCQAVKDFFSMPDKEHTWDEWLRMLLEDLFVIDAPTAYPRMTNGGALYAIEPMDGAMIKRVIDDRGRTPLPPDPAYQAIIKGMPAVNYSRDELIYKPRNPRTHKIYGFSPVEQIITTVNIALRRQVSQLQYYTEGSTPDLIMSVPSTWNPDQIRHFKEMWDSMLAGNTGTRRGTMFVPDGVKPINTKEEVLKDQYDEWLARVVCYAFSIEPTAFVKAMNRATAETQREQALTEGLAPNMKWLKGLINYIIVKYFGYTDIEFVWAEEESLDPKEQAEINDRKIRNGSKTINECRAEDGLDAVEGGDEHLIYTASGAVKLSDVVNPPEEPELPAAPAPGAIPNDDAAAQPGAKPETDEAGKNPEDATGKGAEKLQKKKTLTPINRDRKSVVKARKKLCVSIKKFLAGQAQKIADQIGGELGKVAKSGTEEHAAIAEAHAKRVQEILEDLDFTEWNDIVPGVESVLMVVAKDGAKEGAAQLGVDSDTAILDQANEGAIEYAKARAAEMVGMKYVDGDLVPNPDADWQITEGTREMLRSTVTQALEEGWSNDELSDAIADSYAFSDERADMIARTETANADVQGNFATYRASGIVAGKAWILGPGSCDICAENADAGVIDLEDTFPSGDDAPTAHPNCTCDVLPVLDDEDES